MGPRKKATLTRWPMKCGWPRTFEPACWLKCPTRSRFGGGSCRQRLREARRSDVLKCCSSDRSRMLWICGFVPSGASWLHACCSILVDMTAGCCVQPQLKDCVWCDGCKQEVHALDLSAIVKASPACVSSARLCLHVSSSIFVCLQVPDCVCTYVRSSIFVCLQGCDGLLHLFWYGGS